MFARALDRNLQALRIGQLFNIALATSLSQKRSCPTHRPARATSRKRAGKVDVLKMTRAGPDLPHQGTFTAGSGAVACSVKRLRWGEAITDNIRRAATMIANPRMPRRYLIVHRESVKQLSHGGFMPDGNCRDPRVGRGGHPARAVTKVAPVDHFQLPH